MEMTLAKIAKEKDGKNKAENRDPCIFPTNIIFLKGRLQLLARVICSHRTAGMRFPNRVPHCIQLIIILPRKATGGIDTPPYCI